MIESLASVRTRPLKAAFGALHGVNGLAPSRRVWSGAVPGPECRGRLRELMRRLAKMSSPKPRGLAYASILGLKKHAVNP